MCSLCVKWGCVEQKSVYNGLKQEMRNLQVEAETMRFELASLQTKAALHSTQTEAAETLAVNQPIAVGE